MKFEEVKSFENELKLDENIKNIPSLLKTLLEKEEDYRSKKLKYEQEFNKKMVTLNWNEITKERVETGLPKISSKEMREAYIGSELEIMEKEFIDATIEYHHTNRLYEMAYKYSFEVLK